jgi:hypothetical protein
VERAELALAELGGLKRGRLMLHASQTIASYWLPRHLVSFRQCHPGIDIRLIVGNTAAVAADVVALSRENRRTFMPSIMRRRSGLIAAVRMVSCIGWLLSVEGNRNASPAPGCAQSRRISRVITPRSATPASLTLRVRSPAKRINDCRRVWKTAPGGPPSSHRLKQ